MVEIEAMYISLFVTLPSVVTGFGSSWSDDEILAAVIDLL